MSWAIIADSSCNLRTWEPTAPGVVFRSVPLTIHVGGEEFVDDAKLDVEELNQRVADEQTASSSSCPSVGVWADQFRAYDRIIAITISANLSGSFEAATTARNIVMEEHMLSHDGRVEGKDIYVLNSRAAGGKLEVLVTLLDRFLREHPGAEFDEAVSYIQEAEQNSQVLFSLSSYENLVKNGRISRLAGAVASKFNIRMLGTASDEGTIKMVGSTRGGKKMLAKTIESMTAMGYRGGLAYIDHVKNLTGAQALRDAILAAWPQAEVEIIPCGGLCSYYAETSGLIVGFEWA